MTRLSSLRTSMRPWLVSGLAVVLWAGFALRSVVADGDITLFTAFGVNAEEISDHAEAELGREVFERTGQGHDGKFFFLQALDPLFLTPDEHAVLLDRPVYRGQRMLYPLLAGAGGLMPARGVPWLMVAVNIMAAGFGTAGVARIAQDRGRSPWWGLAFALNLGLFAEYVISGAGVVSFAAVVWALVMLEEERPVRAAAFLTAAVLAREVMLLAVAGVALHAWFRNRRIPWILIVPPVAAVGAWGLYLRVRLDEGSGVSEVQEIGWPFGGMIQSVGEWTQQPLDLAVALVLVLVAIAVVAQAIVRPSYVSWAGLGFVALGPLLTAQVWMRYFDISRALAPILTLYVVSAFVIGDGSLRPAELGADHRES